MVAQNAEYDEIYFEDYEGSNGSFINEDSPIIAHSGEKVNYIGDGEYLLPGDMIDKVGNYLIKFWCTTDIDEGKILLLNGSTSPKKIARVGQWTLYETEMELGPSTNPSLSISYTGTECLLDDLRIQPENSQAACFVYDVNTYKLLAQFDDQHFGIFYQYNAEGQLVRKIIETEKGRKTIQETQYNTKTVARIAQ
jgi:hypothetical protein